MQKPQRLLRFLQKEEEKKNEKEIIESITCIIKSKYEEKKHINIKFLLSYEKVLCKFSKKKTAAAFRGSRGVQPFPDRREVILSREYFISS